MNKVIIPTDFSVKSLNFLIEFIKNNPSKKHNIVLIHGYEISDSISELLFFSKGKLYKKLASKEFNDALHIIKNRYESAINSISYDFITSENKNYLQTYIETQNVTTIVAIENYVMHFRDKKSFSINELIDSANVNKYTITNKNEYVLENTELISDVFISKI